MSAWKWKNKLMVRRLKHPEVGAESCSNCCIFIEFLTLFSDAFYVPEIEKEIVKNHRADLHNK